MSRLTTVGFESGEVRSFVSDAISAGCFFCSHPYYDLTIEDIDPGLRKAVSTINKSGWVATYTCCEGHADKGLPIRSWIGVTCRRKDLSHVLELWYRTLHINRRKRKINFPNEITPGSHLPVDHEWSQLILELHSPHEEKRKLAMKIFQQFGKMVRSDLMAVE